MPEKRKPGRPKTFDRDSAVTLALQTYWQDGVQEMSINEICRRTGVSKPSLYREFGGEDGLLVAVLQEYFRVVLEPASTRLDPARSFRDNVEGLIAFMTTPSAVPSGCMHVMMRGAMGRLGSQAQRVVEQYTQGMCEVYAGIIRPAQERGEVRPDLSEEQAVAYFDIQVVTAFRMMAEGKDPERVRDLARIGFSALEPTRS